MNSEQLISFKILLNILFQRLKLTLFFGFLFLSISLLLNHYNKYEQYTDIYYIYFNDEIYLIQTELRNQLIKDALNMPIDQNYNVEFNLDKKRISFISSIENSEYKQLITNQLNIIFANFISSDGQNNAVKAIKKSSLKKEMINNELNPIFFFLFGYFSSVIFLCMKSLNNYFQDKK